MAETVPTLTTGATHPWVAAGRDTIRWELYTDHPPWCLTRIAPSGQSQSRTCVLVTGRR